MAISNSFDWIATEAEIIKQALRKIGGVAIGADPSADQVTEARWELNALVQNLTVTGINLWRVSKVKKDLDASINTLALDDYVIGIEDLWIEYNDTVYPVKLISKFDYADIVDRTQTGRPLRAWLEMVMPPKLWFDKTTDIADYDLYYYEVKRLADFDAPTNNPDAPVRWVLPLVYLLAAVLAPNYKVPIQRARELERTGMGLIKAAKAGNKEIVDDDFVSSCF